LPTDSTTSTKQTGLFGAFATSTDVSVESRHVSGCQRHFDVG
jgi:hypothetical protein